MLDTFFGFVQMASFWLTLIWMFFFFKYRWFPYGFILLLLCTLFTPFIGYPIWRYFMTH